MVANQETTDGEFHHDVLELVHRGFGPEGLTRFFALYGNHLGDYTRDRHQWLGEQTLDPDEDQPQPESHTQAA